MKFLNKINAFLIDEHNINSFIFLYYKIKILERKLESFEYLTFLKLEY